MMKLLLATAGTALLSTALPTSDLKQQDLKLNNDPTAPVKVSSDTCRRYPDVKGIFGTKIDVGTCKGFCRSTQNPWHPIDVPKDNAAKGGVRLCLPKLTAVTRVPYNRIESCDCLGDRNSVQKHELQTDNDFIHQLHWERRGDFIFIDQELEIHDDIQKCKRLPKMSKIGTDAHGKPIVVDVGQCMGQCPVVSQDPNLTINLTLTGDDLIQRVYIDGTDRTTDLVNGGAWTTGDTILQTVLRAPGSEHVIAVQALDVARSMQGLIATVAYDGSIQHLTGSGDWIAMSSAPADDTDGRSWYMPGYDASSFAAPTVCSIAEANVWGTFWPAAFLNDGARWIWGPDNQCRVRNAPSVNSWFLLKFTIPLITPTKCQTSQISKQYAKVEIVRSCGCQCKYKQECKAPLVWNDNKCQCECGIDASSCPTGTIFNAKTCSCENCGVCSAKTEDECIEKQCLFTFFPFSDKKGQPGSCVWRDFNGDGRAECGCPQNQCQTVTSQSPNAEGKCKETVCNSGSEGATEERCDFNKNRLAGAECDCADNQA